MPRVQTPREGPIALADISVYTAFVAGTELEHSGEILTELLTTVTDALARHLDVVKLQGDALLCVGERTGADLVEWLEVASVAFHRRIRDMALATTCDCAACVNVSALTLKFVAHHGTFSRIHVRGSEDLVGNDVNVACRLLKNAIPSREYLFATAPVLERIPRELRERFVEHVERYDDVGEVRGAYRDLADVRERARRPERMRVAREEALARVEAVVRATPARIYAALMEPGEMTRVLAVDRVDRKPGARGGVIGTEYHCFHGKDARHPAAILRILSTAPPHEVTLFLASGGGVGYATASLDALDPARTRVEVLLTVETHRGLRGAVERVLLGRYLGATWRANLRRLAEVVEARP